MQPQSTPPDSMLRARSHDNQAVLKVKEMGPYLGVTLGCQWMTIRGITANRKVKSMVAHCCEASMNLKFTERNVQAFAPFPTAVDLRKD